MSLTLRQDYPSGSKIREFVKTAQSCLRKISVRIKVFILRECMGKLTTSSLLNIFPERSQVHVNFSKTTTTLTAVAQKSSIERRVSVSLPPEFYLVFQLQLNPALRTRVYIYIYIYLVYTHSVILVIQVI